MRQPGSVLCCVCAVCVCSSQHRTLITGKELYTPWDTIAWQIIAGSVEERLATGTVLMCLLLQPREELSRGLGILSHFLITQYCVLIKTFAQVTMHNGKAKGNGKINHTPQRDYQLFPKQFLNKHNCGGNAYAAPGDHVPLEPRQVENANKKMSHQLTCTAAPYQWGHAVWILLPLVNQSFDTTLFLERTLDFPLASITQTS